MKARQNSICGEVGGRVQTNQVAVVVHVAEQDDLVALAEFLVDQAAHDGRLGLTLGTPVKPNNANSSQQKKERWR